MDNIKSTKTFVRYEYPLKDETSGAEYKGSYTILADAKPLGFEGEEKVETFSLRVRA